MKNCQGSGSVYVVWDSDENGCGNPMAICTNIEKVHKVRKKFGHSLMVVQYALNKVQSWDHPAEFKIK